ncbi:Sec-independent protein translocase subunit TatA [Streptomyces sp. BPTC-684]|uniref:Sec-independent protein translocase subunit TatA n=1 Tax=Streptomyces sp. BPTC-684 TaxID=3043734 RepID=UPI0024B20A85|nr:Sec-independent protein translocase subunit TatA [Streptomyces sp. BPTC-684]WHM37998.1 Sec-independent protein translocase subunit TatA [Streptomyces sp. BPTC-684]
MFLRNGLEPWHLLIVAVVLILLFGSKKLPDTARALGKSLRILKSETRAMKDESGSGPGSEPGATAPTAVVQSPAPTTAQAAAQTPAPHPADAPRP